MKSIVPNYMSITGVFLGILFNIAASPLCLGEVQDSGSWFLDMVKYHVSVHGQLSCQDCHSDISRKHVHPNPSDVNRNPYDFFHQDKCFTCHDENSIKGDLSAGTHGGKPIHKNENHGKCIRCHDPHYQPRPNKNLSYNRESSLPGREFCATCHAKKDDLPQTKTDDQQCMECHKLQESKGKVSRQHIDQFCLGCHDSKVVFKGSSVIVPRVDMAKHVSILHKGLDCLACHSDAASFEHNLQRPVLCSNCHNPHDEATLHDAHSKVSCQDCHLTGIELSLDQQTKRIIWRRLPKSFDVSSLNITLPDHGTTSCHQCHKKGNHLGASVTVLPAKSVICMPCHAATFTVSDPITIASLIGFFLGMLAVVSVWFTGKTRTKNNKAGLFDRSDKPAFHVRLFTGLKVLFLDGLLQRRLFEHSHYRWFIHTLIFWPFMIRFVWGLTALIGSLVWPSNPWIWQMLNKNNPITAVLFDLTGVSILLGILLAILRKKMSRDESLVAGLPERDWLAVILLAAIVIVGFVLEGARIALTGETDINHFAFVGWALSLLWLGISGLSDIYGYVWYLHALLTGVFLIYLPFSGMLHLIMAPLAMALTFTDTNHPNH